MIPTDPETRREGGPVSLFDVMTDALFATHLARGVADRTALIIVKAARDADALTAADET